MFFVFKGGSAAIERKPIIFCDFANAIRMKKALVAVAITALVLFCLDLDVTRDILGKVRAAVYPVFFGVLIALFLNAPVKILEKGLLSSPKIARFRRTLSLGITLIVIAGAAAGLVALVAPQIRQSVSGLGRALEDLKTDHSSAFGKALGAVIDEGGRILREKLPDLATLAIDGVKEAVSLFLGLAIGVMLAASKESVAGLMYTAAKKIAGEEKAALFRGALSAAADKFSKFLGGQVLEALIFGTASYLVFLVFKIPYPLLIALIVAVTNLIPTIGGYIGGALGAVAVLAADPAKVVAFIIIVLVLQQIEQVTTYPVIVGKYVGLKSFYVLLAVVVGGGLFGFWGLVLAVPVAAFAYNLATVLLDRKKRPDPAPPETGT